jgi:hypothetical protein
MKRSRERPYGVLARKRLIIVEGARERLDVHRRAEILTDGPNRNMILVS